MENLAGFKNPVFTRLSEVFGNNANMWHEREHRAERSVLAYSGPDNAGNAYFTLHFCFIDEGKRIRDSRLVVTPLNANKMKLVFAFGNAVNISEAKEVVEVTLSNKEAVERIGHYALNLSPEFAAFIHDSMSGKISTAKPVRDSLDFNYWR